MIEGVCRTNLDAYKTANFPTVFVAVPRLGESVEDDRGRQLKVHKITHLQKSVKVTEKDEFTKTYFNREMSIPYIEIDLNL